MITVSVNVAFNLPTLRADGSPLLPEDIAEVRLYKGSVSGSWPNAVASIPSPATSGIINIDGSVDNYINARAVDTLGQLSPFATEVLVEASVAAVPNAVDSLTVS